jgi:hypothetical protein
VLLLVWAMGVHDGAGGQWQGKFSQEKAALCIRKLSDSVGLTK